MSKADGGEFAPTAPGTPDKKGVPCDPDLHQKYAGGRAMKNVKTGEWVEKGGRGKKKPDAVKPAAQKASGAPDPIAAHERKDPAEGLHEPETTKPAKVAGNTSTIPEDAMRPDSPTPLPGIPGGSIDPADAQLDATCRTAIVMAEGLCMMALGPDMKHSDDERAALLESWKLFLAGKDMRLPPWLALTACYVTLAAARADKPSFRERCALWGSRLKRWFSR